MLEILKWIFSDFWIWFGCILMLEVIRDGVIGIFGGRRCNCHKVIFKEKQDEIQKRPS